MTRNARKKYDSSLSFFYVFCTLIFLTGLILVPLVIHPDFYHPFNAPKILVMAFLAMILAPFICIFIISDKCDKFRIFSFFPVTLAAWTGLHFLSALFSHKIIYSIGHAAFFLSCMIFSFWAFMYGKKKLRSMAYILAGVVIISAFYGFLQFAGYDFITLEMKKLPVSFFGNANFAAQFLIAVLPLLIAFAYLGPYRRIFISSSVLLSFHLLLLKSRGGILGGILGVFFLTVCIYKIQFGVKSARRIRLIRWNKKAVIILVLGIMITGSTFFYLDQGETLNEISSSFRVSPESNRYRLLAWKASLRLASDHPFLGVGPGNYRFYHQTYSSAELWKMKGTFSRVRLLRAHNDYINILCENGIPGLFLFLLIMGYLFRNFRIFIKEKSGKDAIILSGIMGGIAATLFQSLFDFNLYNPASAFIFWILAGCAAGIMVKRSVKISTSQIKMKNAGAWIILTFSIVAIFIISPVLGKKIKNEINIRKAYVYFQNGLYGRAAQSASVVLDKNPGNIDASAIYADALRNAGMEEKAVGAYLHWASLEENYVPVYNRLGECYFRLGKDNKAEKAFKKALSINPYNIAVLLNLGNLSLKKHDYKKSVSYFSVAEESGGGDLFELNQAQYGISLMKLKKYKEAIPRLKIGIQKLPDKAPLLLEFLGDSYYAIGLKKKAKEVYKQAWLIRKTPSLKEKINSLYTD
jgi:O-antigen ligase/Tfp pilus assembly protein PilF